MRLGRLVVVGLAAVGERWDARLTGPAEPVFRGEWTEAVAPLVTGA